ncbi:MAG: patatin-like phospholipase family protein [Bacteroidales bacterium]
MQGQRVGLVLSGGGARGVTHIGVLKALEENDIPIDYITGTSMGAIIGGLYASGFTPDEIESLLATNQMQLWIKGSEDGSQNFYFQQPDPNASWQLFKITYDSILRARLPTNTISPFRLDFGFTELFSGAGAAANYNFDNLYIPFRCVASDITDNKLVVLKSGNLGKAIRASMTFPFLIKPIRIDGKLMFDGGMYNNFPVDVLMNEFEPEIVIGSKAASNYGPPTEDDVISQIQSMLMANTNYDVDTTMGVLIVPELWSVALADFSNTKAFIDSGYVSTLRQIPRIKELVKLRETPKEKNQKRDEFFSKIPSVHISDIVIKGLTPKQTVYTNRLIRKEKLLEKMQSQELSIEQSLEIIKSKYYRILSDNQVASVSAELKYDEQGNNYKVIYDIKKTHMLEAEIGGLISSKAINEIFLQLQYQRWTKYALSITGNTYLGRFHNSGHGRIRFDIPLRVPVAFELSYTLNGWNYFNTSTYFLEDVKPVYLIQNDSYWKFNMITPVSQASKLLIDFETGSIKDEYYQNNQFSRSDTTDETSFDFYSPGIIFELNTLNRKQYASQGTLFRLCGRFISGSELHYPGSTSLDTSKLSDYHNWLQIRALYDKYFSISRVFKLGVLANITLSNKPIFNNYTATVLSAPSFAPLPEMHTIFLPQFRANNFLAGGVKMIFSFIRNLDFRAEGYIFQPEKEILKNVENKAVYGPEFSKRYYIASGSFVYHAPFGPVSICLNYYDQADDPYSFNVNIGYFIFNKRPFN